MRGIYETIHGVEYFIAYLRACLPIESRELRQSTFVVRQINLKKLSYPKGPEAQPSLEQPPPTSPTTTTTTTNNVPRHPHPPPPPPLPHPPLQLPHPHPPPPNPPRLPPPPPQTPLHLHPTNHPLGRQHLHAPHHLPDTRLRQHQRHAQQPALEPVIAETAQRRSGRSGAVEGL